VLTFFRGCIVACFPVPLAYGSSYEDLRYIVPDRKTTPLTRDILQVGKFLSSSAGTDERWADRKKLYKDWTGAEAAAGAKPFLMLLRTEEWKIDTPVKDMLPIMEEFAELAVDWRRKLRPGCVEPHEVAIAKAITAVLSDSSTPEPQLDDLNMFVKCSAGFTTHDGRKLHASLVAKVKTATCDDAMNKFDQIVAEYLNSPSLENVIDLFAVLKSMVGQVALTQANVKGIVSLGTAFLGVLRDLKEMPFEGDACCRQAFEAAPGFLRLVVENATPEDGQVFTGCIALLDAVFFLHNKRRSLLNVLDYDQHHAPLQAAIAKLEAFMGKLAVGHPKTSTFLEGSSYLSAMHEFIRLCKRDSEKALVQIGERYDDDFIAQIERCEVVSGGSDGGKHWYDDFQEGGPVTLLMHFEKTLDKINVDALCARVTQMNHALEPYAVHRPEAQQKDALLDRASKALFDCRVTQLEMVLFRTARKSSKPKERPPSAFACFESEDHPCKGRVAAYESIGAPVRKYLQTTYNLLIEPPPEMPGAAPASGGA
jgi:hypothetical protein